MSLFGEHGMPGAHQPVDATLIARSRGETTPTNVSIFQCQRTKKMVACNSVARPFSPFASSTTMKRISTGTMPVTAAEVKAETIRLATCQNCDSRLHAFPTVIRAAALNPDFNSVICITCGTKVPVRADLEDLYGENGTRINEDGQVLMANGEVAPEYNADAEHDADLMPTEVNLGGENAGPPQIPSLSADGDDDSEGSTDDTNDNDFDNTDDPTMSGDGEDGDNENGDTSDDQDADGMGDDDDDTYTGDGSDPDSDEISAAVTAAPRQRQLRPAASTSHHRRRAAALAGEETSEEMEGNDGVVDNVDDSDGGEGGAAAAAPVITSSSKLKVTAFDTLDTSALNTYGVLQLDSESAAVFASTANGYQPMLLLEAKHASANNRSLFAKADLLAQAFAAVVATPGFKMSPEALREFGARAFTLEMTAGDYIAKRISDGVKEATAALAVEKQTLVETFRQCLSIAGLEVLKNLNAAAPNPVRAALVQDLTQNGVRDAGKMVDLAFASHGDKLLKTIIAKAVALSSKPLEVRNELAAVFATAATQQPPIPTDANEAAAAERVAQNLADGSLPVSASTREVTDFIPPVDRGATPPSNPKLTALVRGAFAATRHRAAG